MVALQLAAAFEAHVGTAWKGPRAQQVLLFNCMKERDPAAQLPALARTLASRGVAVQQVALQDMLAAAASAAA